MKKIIVKHGIDDSYNIYKVKEKVSEINNLFTLGMLAMIFNKQPPATDSLLCVFIKARCDAYENIIIDVISFKGEYEQIFFFNMAIKEL